MSVSPVPVRPASRSLLRKAFVALALIAASGVAASPGPEADYPFIGTWIRADRVCTAGAALVRTYTAKDVTSARGRCSIRRVTSGAGAFELLEQCQRGERPSTVTETIRMSSPDAMTLRRQVVRLKIPRNVRYVRCAAPTPAPVHPPR